MGDNGRFLSFEKARFAGAACDAERAIYGYRDVLISLTSCGFALKFVAFVFPRSRPKFAFVRGSGELTKR